MSAATLARRLRLTDSYGLSLFGVLSAVVLGSLVLVLVLVLGITLGSRAYGRTSCRHWGEQTGYQTRFVVLNWADTGTCLAEAPNGRWVLNTKVLEIAGRP